MKVITSKDNPKVKAAIKVRRGKDRNNIFVEGRRLAEEALSSGIPVRAAFFSSGFLSAEENLSLATVISRGPTPAFELDDKLFHSLADTASPQGIVLICSRPVATLEDLAAQAPPLPVTVFLDRASNPGNLGAILRTTEAAGATGVITSAGSVDAFSPAVLRGSMGASFRVPVAEKVPEAQAFDWARRKGLKVIVAASDAVKSYLEADLTSPSLIVFGSEAHGTSPAAMEAADEKIMIPMENGVESLNLAVSAGIVLFEARRQAAAVSTQGA